MAWGWCAVGPVINLAIRAGRVITLKDCPALLHCGARHDAATL